VAAVSNRESEVVDHFADGLCTADAYPDDPSARRGVEHVETHISHVFLTGDLVYKLRKAIRFGCLDFGTLEKRHADCLHEVQLNRRLAPDVYLGVAPIQVEGGRPRVGETDEFISTPLAEHCVVMRRLANGFDAATLVRAGRITEGQIDLLADRIARFHDDNAIVWSASRDEQADVAAEAMQSTIGEIDDASLTGDDRLLLETVRERSASGFETRRGTLASRAASGRIVDGHGDLRLEHVWFEPGRPEPVVIDGVEFDQDSRRIDPASDLAFLTMDLRWNLRSDLAERLLGRYANTADDFGLYEVMACFEAYHSCVRAKVAHLKRPTASLRDRDRLDTVRHEHLELAAELLAPPPSSHRHLQRSADPTATRPSTDGWSGTVSRTHARSGGTR